ncbi:MAG: hypothetical protein QUV06_14740 [Cyanobium sp. CZS 48M]|nr:hypothetical protein [Cyanobium sp. CZS48M]
MTQAVASGLGFQIPKPTVAMLNLASISPLRDRQIFGAAEVEKRLTPGRHWLRAKA